MVATCLGQQRRKAPSRSLGAPTQEALLDEIRKEAARQDRSLSWIVQKAWKIARRELTKFPSVNDIEDSGDNGDERGRVE